MKPYSQTDSCRKLFSRIDLHVHTRFSKNADDWLLSQLGVNESYTTPQQVWERALKQGMDYVTITDHDCIDGALQLAHHDRFFISEEISAFFPDEPVKIHVVALDIDEEKHKIIQELRFNLYELVSYLNKSDILHFVAHPFFRMSEQLELAHFEKMLLLFKNFEVKNGGKQIYPDDFLIRLLKTLTPENLWQVAEKYDIMPVGDHPWEKNTIAGSDDHGGIYIGSLHTRTPRAENVDQLLSFIRNGYACPQGDGGSPLKVAHSIFSVAFQHFAGRQKRQKTIYNLLGQIFNSYDHSQNLNVKSKLTLFALCHVPDRLFNHKHQNGSMLSVVKQQLKSDSVLNQLLKDKFDFKRDDEKLLQSISQLVNQIIVLLLPDILENPSSLPSRFTEIKFLLPLVIPYLVGFKTEYRDRPLMRRAAKRFFDDDSTHFAVFAEDVGAQRFLRHIRMMSENPRNLSYHIFCKKGGSHNAQTFAFSPLQKAHLSALDMHIDMFSFFDIARAFYKRHIDKIYIHSLTVLSLYGLLLGKWMQIPVIMRYPDQEIKRYFLGLPKNKRVIGKNMIRFAYNLSDGVLYSSAKAKRHAIHAGIDRKKLIFAGSTKVRIVSYDKSISGYELTL